ncbi:unnamed protein product [Rhizoctonia solani]|uniref:Uncharacterized protein n=1 Tax=Rhizoctonia solani TaxID=456999 RepID=A0A8H3D3X3_9AGAM|nr:unnamed protein product [Rhizoctonia solani]
MVCTRCLAVTLVLKQRKNHARIGNIPQGWVELRHLMFNIFSSRLRPQPRPMSFFCASCGGPGIGDKVGIQKTKVGIARGYGSEFGQSGDDEGKEFYVSGGRLLVGRLPNFLEWFPRFSLDSVYP